MTSQCFVTSQCYLFIDGGHLRENYNRVASEWFKSDTEFEIRQITNSLSGDKCFYYDCLDDVPREGETREQTESRVNDQQRLFDGIRETFATHVRLGKLMGEGKRKRQKQVDIQLAVDALNHAFRRNMDHVVLLTGDQDFTPVVKALVDMGLYVTVAGDRFHTSRDLIQAADYYRPLTVVDYHQFSAEATRPAVGFPSVSNSLTDTSDWTLKSKGTVGGQQVELYVATQDYWLVYKSEKHPQQIGFRDLARLKLFADLHYGKIQWE